MTIGVYTFEIHLPGARSLKEKRQVVRRLKGRLRNRHNVAVAELEEHAGLWQRASVAVVSVGAGRDGLVRLFEAAHLETGSEFIEAADGGPAGWSGDWE